MELVLFLVDVDVGDEVQEVEGKLQSFLMLIREDLDSEFSESSREVLILLLG